MPMKPKRPCRWPMCKNLTDDKRGYCEKHRGAGDRAYKASRADTAEQKLYTSARWRSIRALKLQQNPLCEICEKENKIVPACIVHHKTEIKAGGDPFSMEGLEAVCASCHRRLHG